MLTHSLHSRSWLRFSLSLLALFLLQLIALGCGGGGGGTTPPPTPPQGTVTGQVLLGSGLPVIPQGDGSRASTRIIDPQDIIAALPAPVGIGTDGRFTIPAVQASTTTVYLQVSFIAGLNLAGGGAGQTPVAINIPVGVGDGRTSTVVSGIETAAPGGTPQGLIVNSVYTGPDGKRNSRSFINFVNNTIMEDLNGDGIFDDNVSPDNNRDGVCDDRNRYDDNPGAYGEIEETGPIQALTNDTVTVNGILFKVTGATQIFGDDDDDPLQLSDFNVGDLVEAEGYQLAGSSDIFAKKVKSEDRLDDDDPVNPLGSREVEREGLLLAKTANSVTVLDITFQVTAATQIVIKDTGAPITLNDIPVGACLDAKGNRTENGIIATRLRYDDDCDDNGIGGLEIEVEGRIDALTSDSITVNGKTFEVILPIEIVNKDTDQPIAFSSLKVGDFADVRGIQTETTLRANRIRFDPNGDDDDDDDDDGGGGGGTGIQIEREGVCQAKTATTITVLNTTFQVPATGVEIVIKDTDEPIPFSSIQVGEEVDVRGIQNGTTIVANRIRVDREDEDDD